MFGRRTAPETVDPEVDGTEPESPQGKGRPTPKRRDAEAARKKRNSPPRTKKEANKLHKERMREQRLKQRKAMETGEERYLPARDRGSVRRFIRDWVDARRTIGEFLLPVFFLIVVMVYIRTPYSGTLSTFLWLVILAAMVLDSVRVVRGVKKAITVKFGADETKGITMYALMRSWQMRRLRLPKPQVKRGETVK